MACRLYGAAEFTERMVHFLENPGYEVRVLSRSTIRDWLPTFEVEADAISVQHFTDLLRLELLRVYGGIWVDASMVVRASFDDLFDGEVEAPSASYDLESPRVFRRLVGLSHAALADSGIVA